MGEQLIQLPGSVPVVTTDIPGAQDTVESLALPVETVLLPEPIESTAVDSSTYFEQLNLQHLRVPFQDVRHLFPAGHYVSVDVNGYVSLLIPSSTLTNECVVGLQTELGTSSHALQTGGGGTDNALQSVVDSSSSSPSSKDTRIVR